MKHLIPAIVICLCTLFVLPARADWCQVTQNGGRGTGAMVVCDGPFNNYYQECGTKDGQTQWCLPAAKTQSRSKRHDNSTVILISAGIGLGVAAVAWYFFHKRPSENNPGQVQLATF